MIKTKLEVKSFLICVQCSTAYGKHELANECDGECGEYFSNKETVFCNEEGKHYCEECHKEMKATSGEN